MRIEQRQMSGRTPLKFDSTAGIAKLGESFLQIKKKGNSVHSYLNSFRLCYSVSLDKSFHFTSEKF